MPDKAVYLLVVDGFADWEAAHAVAELRRHGGYRVEAVGLTRNPVVSMGGLRVAPSRTVGEIELSDVAAFILPGGDRWEKMPMEVELDAAFKRLDAGEIPIAAICAATVAIARVGLLRGRQHTSNGLKYLQSHVPGYNEAQKLCGGTSRARPLLNYGKWPCGCGICPRTLRGAGCAFTA